MNEMIIRKLTASPSLSSANSKSLQTAENKKNCQQHWLPTKAYVDKCIGHLVRSEVHAIVGMLVGKHCYQRQHNSNFPMKCSNCM